MHPCYLLQQDLEVARLQEDLLGTLLLLQAGALALVIVMVPLLVLGVLVEVRAAVVMTVQVRLEAQPFVTRTAAAVAQHIHERNASIRHLNISIPTRR